MSALDDSENPTGTKPARSGVLAAYLPLAGNGGRASIDESARKVGIAMSWAMLIGSLIAILWNPKFWTSALMWAAASSAVGWFLGFLFGIPRSLAKADRAVTNSSNIPGDPQGEDPPVANLQKGNLPAATSNSPSSFGVNTNLEEISDWLTKIIVGVTLVELGKARVQLDEAAKVISGSLGGGGSSVSFAYALMLYFSLSGFLGSYLLTRLYLQKAFQHANLG